MSAFNHHLLRFQLIIIGHYYCYYCEKSSCPPALDNLSLCFHFSKVIEDPVNKQKMFIFNGCSTDNVAAIRQIYGENNVPISGFPQGLHGGPIARKASIREIARSTVARVNPPPPPSAIIERFPRFAPGSIFHSVARVTERTTGGRGQHDDCLADRETDLARKTGPPPT